MKSLNKYIILVGVVSLFASCIIDTNLREVPKDFYSPENSFVSKANFESALADIYKTIRNNLHMNYANVFMFGVDSDVNVSLNTDDEDGNPRYNEYMNWNTLNKDNTYVRNQWQFCYNWIFKANVVIDRVEDENARLTDDEKAEIMAEAKFLRAFSYRFLANMWGDVPLVLKETTAPKFDFVRTPRAEVYQQCKDDLTEAIKYMKTVDQQPAGRAPRAAAYHLLSEINICLGDYQGAIAAASAVINNPNFYLMTERFGVRTNFTFNGYTYQGPQKPWGDVYWDLFQEGNMNWKEGNHESIWNIQRSPTILGGGQTPSGGSMNFEHLASPIYWTGPDINAVANWLKDTLCGRPAGALNSTYYMSELVWQYKGDYDRDIRNSEYNIQRIYYWVNPNGEFYGQPCTRETYGLNAWWQRMVPPSFKKGVTTVHYGLARDASSGQNHDNAQIFKDWYMMRLPETYLLRAEAKFRSGDLQGAADDINVVRGRAKATLVDASDVDIDLILDERARELYLEEFRYNTLMRMGKMVERLHRYNGNIIWRNYKIADYKNLFPIPQSEIEANKDGGLTQIPEYE